MNKKRIMKFRKNIRILSLVIWTINIILWAHIIYRWISMQPVEPIKKTVLITSEVEEELVVEPESYRSRLCGLESVTCKEEKSKEATIKTDLDIIKDLSSEYEMDWKLVYAIVLHETGKMTSRAYLELNNPGGWQYWSTEQNTMVFYKFNSIEEGYEFMIKTLKNNYINQGLTTIEKIGNKYCPKGINDKGQNKYWVPKVTEFYESLI